MTPTAVRAAFWQADLYSLHRSSRPRGSRGHKKMKKKQLSAMQISRLGTTKVTARTPDEVDKVRWRQLAARSRAPDPFACSPAWQLPFWRSQMSNGELFIMQTEKNLLLLKGYRAAPNTFVLGPPENMWFFGCNVLGRKGAEFLRDSLPDIERQFACQSLAITVSGISPTGLLRRDLQRYFKADFEIVEMDGRARGVQCTASLKGGWDGYLSRRSSNTRRNIRKQLRRADEAGVVFEQHCPIPLEADHLFDRMLVVELQSWKGIAEQGMEQPGVVDFYHLMLRELSKTADARVIMARFEDRDIGFIFGGMLGKIYRGQQFSFVDDWASGSIGNTLQTEQIKWLCEESANRYDLGPLHGPAMEYKQHWTDQRYRVSSVVLRRR
jgi:CelD/BcsL family acetyltransferase involved in cellulose biosynthesis